MLTRFSFDIWYEYLLTIFSDFVIRIKLAQQNGVQDDVYKICGWKYHVHIHLSKLRYHWLDLELLEQMISKKATRCY